MIKKSVFLITLLTVFFGTLNFNNSTVEANTMEPEGPGSRTITETVSWDRPPYNMDSTSLAYHPFPKSLTRSERINGVLYSGVIQLDWYERAPSSYNATYRGTLRSDGPHPTSIPRDILLGSSFTPDRIWLEKSFDSPGIFANLIEIDSHYEYGEYYTGSLSQIVSSDNTVTFEGWLYLND